MSFERTRSDLCADEVSLDYQALLQTTQTAYSLGLKSIYKCYQELASPVRFEDIRGTWSCIQAHALEAECKRFSVVAETLYALTEGLTRHELKIVNKPEVKEERT